MKNLQERINARAEIKLHERVRNLRSAIHNDSDFLNFLGNFYTEIEGNRYSLRDALWRSDQALFKLFSDKIRQEMQEKETEIFLNEIDDLKNQVANLFDNNNSEY